MTREEAHKKLFTLCGTEHFTNVLGLVNEIYDHFEAKNCANCVHKKELNSKSICDCNDSFLWCSEVTDGVSCEYFTLKK